MIPFPLLRLLVLSLCESSRTTKARTLRQWVQPTSQSRNGNHRSNGNPFASVDAFGKEFRQGKDVRTNGSNRHHRTNNGNHRRNARQPTRQGRSHRSEQRQPFRHPWTLSAKTTNQGQPLCRLDHCNKIIGFSTILQFVVQSSFPALLRLSVGSWLVSSESSRSNQGKGVRIDRSNRHHRAATATIRATDTLSQLLSARATDKGKDVPIPLLRFRSL